MDDNSYTQFTYNPEEPDALTVTQVPQARSSSEPDLNEVEKELAAQLAKDVEQYTRQEQAVESETDADLEQAPDLEMDKNAAQSDGHPAYRPQTMEEEQTAQSVQQECMEGTNGTQSVQQECMESTQEKQSVQQECMKNILSGCSEDIGKITGTLIRLEKKFDSEILNAQNRDSAVKAVYKEMNEYKAGLVEKAMKNVLYDIVDFRETMLAQIRYLREKKDAEGISLEDFESYAEDLADILERYDVMIYKGEPGQDHTAVRQKIVRKVETEEDTLVKKVAESLSYGYEYNKKVLYPEKISVYVKKKQ